MENLFASVAMRGYLPVPVVPPTAEISTRSMLSKKPQSAGKAVGVRGNDGLWRGYNWVQAAAPSEADLAAWHAMGAGVGIRTGKGIVALDIDITNDALSDKAEQLALAILGNAPLRVGRWPKRLLVYATLEDLRYQRIDVSVRDGECERIELLADGKQFVAFGTHPITRKPYEWRRGLIHRDDLPVIDNVKFRQYCDAIKADLPCATIAKTSQSIERHHVNQEALAGDPEDVRSAVAALPNTSELFPTYDDYIRVGAAIKGATQNDSALGEELFLEWADKWPEGNDPDQAVADYSRIKPPYRIGAQWLYHMAEKHGDFNLAEIWFDPIEEEAELQSHNEPPLYTLAMAADDIENSPDPLIEGLLDQGALSVICAAPNQGKTFIAMDMAYHVSVGAPWADLATSQAPILYISLEGKHGMKLRAKALIDKFGAQAKNAPFYMWFEHLNFYGEHAASIRNICRYADRIGAAQRKAVGLIIIDTLARAMSGADENSVQEMGIFIKAVDQIREHTGAHVMVVHHTGKDPKRGARGSNSLLGAVDTEIMIARDAITITKQRDHATDFAASFTKEPRIVGVASNGKPMKSCTIQVKRDSKTAIIQNTLTNLERDCLKVCKALDNNNSTITLAKAEKIWPEVTGQVKSRDHIRQLMGELVNAGLLNKVGRGEYHLSQL